MRKNLLIVGKELPLISEFADSMVLAGFNVSIIGKPEDKRLLSASDISIIEWNKSSPVSARSVVIRAETEHGFTDNSILYFDAPAFSSKFNSFSVDACSRIIDETVLGYQYITLEILNRIEQHKTNSRIIFILKTHPSMKDVLYSSFFKNSVFSPANPLAAAAAAAFAAFAENTAAFACGQDIASVLLVTGDVQNETMQKDSSLASWLSEYIEACDSQKKRTSAKSAASWVKAGSKPLGAFALFR